MLLLKREAESTLGSAANVAAAALSFERLRDDPENPARWRFLPGFSLRCQDQVAHFHRVLADSGRSGDFLHRPLHLPGAIGMAPVAPSHQRWAIAPEKTRCP